MKRHPFDPVAFVCGAVFLLLGLVMRFARADIETLHLRHVWPLPLVLLGVLIIIAAAREPSSESREPRTGRRRRRARAVSSGREDDSHGELNSSSGRP